MGAEGSKFRLKVDDVTVETWRAPALETRDRDEPGSRDLLVGAVDVQYDDLGRAKAALVVCRGVAFSAVESEHVADITATAPYEPGALFKRELPCIRAVDR